MALGPTPVLSRLTPDKFVMENQQFARWLGRRKGVSAKALASAINLLSQGIIEAMGEGYAVRVWGLGLFENREIGPRRRYHRLNKDVYTSPPTTIVHFSKSENLNKKVRSLAKARLERMASEPSVPLAVRK